MKSFITIFLIVSGLTFNSFAQTSPAIATGAQVKMIKVYPIPATSVVNFEFQRSYDKSYSIEVYNFMGKKIVEFKNPTVRTVFSLNEFSRGLYIFQLRDRNGRVVESGRFQVVK